MSLFELDIQSEDINEIQAKLEKGVVITADVTRGKTELHQAAVHYGQEVIELLLWSGMNMEARDKVQGNTPLHVACLYCNRAAIWTLYQHGADTNALNDHHDTPLAKVLGVVKRRRDFHDESRLYLARELILFGFEVLPKNKDFPRKENNCNNTFDYTKIANSTIAMGDTSKQAQVTKRNKLMSPEVCQTLSLRHNRHFNDNKSYVIYNELLQTTIRSLNLRGLCRLTILRCLRQKPLMVSVGQLGIPAVLQRYLITA